MPAPEPLLLRVADAARLASVGRTLAYELVQTGEWPSVRMGRAVRVPVDGLRAWIKAHTQGGSANEDASSKASPEAPAPEEPRRGPCAPVGGARPARRDGRRAAQPIDRETGAQAAATAEAP